MRVRLTKHRPATPGVFPEPLECSNGHPLSRVAESAGHPVYWCERCRVSGYGVRVEVP